MNPYSSTMGFSIHSMFFVLEKELDYVEELHTVLWENIIFSSPYGIGWK